MYRKTVLLLIICALFPFICLYAQHDYLFFPIRSAQLNPLEQRLAEADFCEITSEQVRIPNYHTEYLADEYPPLEEVTPAMLYHILNKDAVEVFSLAENYPTPLQMKRFKESAEYRDYQKMLDNGVEKLKKQLFYAVFNIETPYDLNTQSFIIEDIAYVGDNFGIADNMYLKSNDPNIIQHNFHALVPNEDIAYNVETHPCCFVIFLRISELNTKTGHILLQPQHGLIANRETGHIYWEYKFQNKPQATRSETASETTSVIEVPASFPGGEAALLSYIGQHIRYPAIAMENGIQGTVVVQFTIDEEGKASKATIIRSLIKECDQEAIRVVLSLPPFKPATKNGKPVATRYTLPLRFSMTQ